MVNIPFVANSHGYLLEIKVITRFCLKDKNHRQEHVKVLKTSIYKNNKNIEKITLFTLKRSNIFTAIGYQFSF